MTGSATLERTGTAKPALGVAAGALGVSLSSVVLAVAGASAGTATFYRCLLALPLLALPALLERGRQGRPSRAQVTRSALAGALFAGDMLLWTQAIFEVGAGVSGVLVNLQAVLVPLLAWLVDREPVSRRYLWCGPVVLAGMVLTAGVFDSATPGADPLLGSLHAVLAAICYSGFLFLLRRGGQRGQVVQSYWVVIAAAAVTGLVAGAVWTGVDLTPGLAALGWLLLVATTGMVIGWLLVARCSPRLPSHASALLLLLTPVGAVLLGALLLGERPSPLQLLGCALVLAGAAWASRSARPPRPASG